MFTQEKSFATVFFMSLVLSTTVPRSAGQVSFANPVSYNVGAQPAAVAVGDFNGDGKMDLAVVDSAVNAAIGDDGGVSILLGNGDGTFQTATNFPAGQNPTNIVAADFNHDGKLDLVVLAASNTVVLLLGNGDGTFQSPSNIPVGSDSVSSLAAGDFNGDGNADLVLENSTGVGILLSNGDGTFQPEVDYSTDGTLEVGNTITGDFNGDKKLDVALVTGGSIGILFGNGDGTLQQPTYTSGGISGIRADDFNGDGRTDLVAFGFEDCISIIKCKTWQKIFLGQSDGTMTALQSELPFFPSASGDVNADGKPDLIFDNSIALGNGDGTFQAPLAANFPGVSAAADLNGDGLSDVLWVDSSNNVVNIFLNTTPGFRLSSSPSSATTSAGGSATYTINVGQQNGFAGEVALACSAPAAAGIHCSASPSSTSPGSSTQLTVTTTGSSASLRLPGTGGLMPLYGLCLPLAGVTLLGFGFASQNERKKALLGWLMLGMLFGSVTFETACGGTSNTGAGNSSAPTPTGNYTITVTGTSGSLQRSVTVTLVVQ